MRTPKPIVWAGSALEDLRGFPDKARSRAGSGWVKMQKRAGTQEAIYVLHAFQKKTQRTATTDLDLAKRRFSEVLRYRQLARS